MKNSFNLMGARGKVGGGDSAPPLPDCCWVNSWHNQNESGGRLMAKLAVQRHHGCTKHLKGRLCYPSLDSGWGSPPTHFTHPPARHRLQLVQVGLRPQLLVVA